MTVAVPIDDPDDPRVAGYVDLRDADLRAAFEHDAGVFVVEGELALAQLLRSPYPLRSVLVAPNRLAAVQPLMATRGQPVFIAGQEVLNRVVGFNLHRGVVALAGRIPLPKADDLLARARRVAVLEQVNDHENLGGLFRNAAAFGIDAMLLDPRTADPLYRRCVRVSIGHALRVPWTRLEPWPIALDRLRGAGFTTLALTPAADAVPIETVAADPPAKVAFMLGAEGPGLTAAAQARADVRVRIPVADGVDSLNVATAAAIAFHQICSGGDGGSG